MSDRGRRLGRGLIVLLGIVVAAILGWWVFVVVPDTLADVLGILLVVATILVGGRVAARVADRAFAPYNVAEVAVSGPIARDGGGSPPFRPGGTPADSIVEQLERADEDRHADALLVKLNTPGGEVIPSDDIRRAALAFDGPTVAYATDVCASGGYWIASGCDELWAHDATVVGSIGVRASRVNASELADRVGVSYERLTAGKYKDAGNALTELSDDERAYLQGLVDDFYENFVDRVTDGRDLDPELVRDTEARVYLGEEAVELGLVDELGDRDDVEARLETLLDEPVEVREFVPKHSLAQRLRYGASAMAYALGAGLGGDREFRIELR